MGGGYYDRSMEESSNSSTGYSTSAAAAMQQKTADSATLPLGRNIECKHHTPIVIGMDVTRSRGDDSKILYDKLPMFFGQLMTKGYCDDPAISFCAIGDATCDTAPLQVCDFSSGNDLDSWLKKLYLEEGGGGTGQETYELAAYFYAKHSIFSNQHHGSSNRNNLIGKKGFFFICGDEAPYPKVLADHISIHVDQNFEGQDLSTEEIFKELQKHYEVFFLFPIKNMESRKADIDAEITRRLAREGAKSGDVCFSLIWNNRNDLDLHVICPSGEEISYSHKKSACGGELDVDMNAGGRVSSEPVENVFWASAPAGKYKCFVHHYAFHESNHNETKFRVAVKTGNDTKYYDSVAKTAGDRVTVCEFDYHGTKKDERAYEKYSDSSITRQWEKVIPKNRILTLDEAKAIVDTMLGIISIFSGKRTLESYMADLVERGQSVERQATVKKALQKALAAPKDDDDE